MKIGILGLGSIGIRHARNIKGMGHEVVHFDPNHGSTAADRDDVIGLADALVIATPTICHYRDLLDCTATGKPIFVEKPIAATYVEWKNLSNLASKVFVGYNLRFHACVRFVEELLDANTVGRPIYASFVCGQLNTKYKDDLISNWSHEIDLARHLLGPCEVLLASMPAPDRADIVLEHDGILSAVHLNYISNPQARAFHIIGTEGWISADLVDLSVEVKSPEHDERAHFATNSWDQCYLDEMEAFINYAAGKEVVTFATGADGLAVLKLCLDAREMAT